MKFSFKILKNFIPIILLVIISTPVISVLIYFIIKNFMYHEYLEKFNNFFVGKNLESHHCLYKSYFVWYDSYFACNYLEQYLKTYDVIIENGKGSVVLHYIDEKKKLKKLKSYPVEFALIYSINFHKDDVIILKELISHKFLNSKTMDLPNSCNMWSPGIKNVESSFLKGETFGGLYMNKIRFKFIYFIQDADGYNLQTIDKSWPALDAILNGNSKAMKHDLILRFEIDPKTIKVRTGSITDTTTDAQLLIDYYKQNYKLKPNVFLAYNNQTKFQLFWINLPVNNYYVDIFFKYNKNKNYNNYNLSLDYLKKFYKIERVLFMHEWYNRYYNKYDS